MVRSLRYIHVNLIYFVHRAHLLSRVTSTSQNDMGKGPTCMLMGADMMVHGRIMRYDINHIIIAQ